MKIDNDAEKLTDDCFDNINRLKHRSLLGK